MTEVKKRGSILTVLAFLGASMFAAQSIQAAVTSGYVRPILTLNSNGASPAVENITVTASGNDIVVASNTGYSATYVNEANQVTTINCTCGTALNTIDLSAVTSASFTALTQTNTTLGNTGVNIFRGTDSKDVVTGGNVVDSIYGNDGNDTLSGANGADVLYGGAGNDSIDTGATAANIAHGDDGNDYITGGANPDTLYGDAGNDYITGGAGADILYGGDGNDILLGDAANDFLYGGDGNDSLNGGDAQDNLYGDAGNDTLDGSINTNNNANTLNGGPGDDLLLYHVSPTGIHGNDNMNGDAGNDVFYFYAAADLRTITLNGGLGLIDDDVDDTSDTIVWDGRNLFYSGDTPSGDESGTISGPGTFTINYSEIEPDNPGSGFYGGVHFLNRISIAILTATPNPMYVNAQASQVGTGVLSIKDEGLLNLDISSLRIVNQSIPGAFSVAGGDWTTTHTVLSNETTTVGIDFNCTLAASDPPATAYIEFVSNTNGGAGVVTTQSLNGYRIDMFTWDGSSGTWDNATSWTPNGVPAREDMAGISAGLVTRPRSLIINPVSGAPSDSLTSLSLTGGTLQITGANSFQLATPNTPYTFVQDGGTLDAEGGYQLGYGANVNSVYTMNDGVLQSAAGALHIGNGFGKGTFNLNKGVIATGPMRLGQLSFATGILNMTDGSITIANNQIVLGNGNLTTGVITMTSGTVSNAGTGGNLYVANGVGTFGRWTQSGGAVTVGNIMYIGGNGGADGLYNLSGAAASLSVTLDSQIGIGGAGGLTVGAGTANLGRDTFLGYSANGAGTLNVNGGVLINTRDLAIGRVATGVMNLTNGAVTVGGLASVATEAGSNGTATISGGTLNAPDLAVGRTGVGVLNMTNGVVTASGLVSVATETGSNGTATISGGTLNAPNLAVGRNGVGVLNMTNGVVTAGGLVSVATETGSNGTANVSSGTLNAANLAVGRKGAGALNISANAALSLSGDLSFGGDATGQGGTGAFSMSGGALTTARINTYPTTAGIASWNWTDGDITVSQASLPIPLTNAGGALIVGGAGIGVTELMPGTTYTQTAGSIAIGIQDVGVADQLLLSSATANLLGGTIDVSVGGGPVSGSWDIVVAQGDGSIDVGALSVTLPGPLWSVTSDSTKITVWLVSPPKLITSASDGVVVFNNILRSNGDTASTRTLEIGNGGDLDLTVTSVTVTGAGFSLVQPVPADLPRTLTKNATDSVTMVFENTTSGTYHGGLTIESNDPSSQTYVLTLRASVLDNPIIASNVETWTRY